MANISIFTAIAWAIAAVFAASGLTHLAGPGFIRRAYARWDFPPRFHLVTGALELLAAVCLTNPLTRYWGIALAAFVTFWAVVTLLRREQYTYSIPGMILLVALVPASLAQAPF
ncbi:MAG TPA: DoxX family protein [Rhizomicrobium sp.]|jgi:hypothetical protein